MVREKRERETFRLENSGVHLELGENGEKDVLENDVRHVQNGEGKGHFGADRIGPNEAGGTLGKQKGKGKGVCI